MSMPVWCECVLCLALPSPALTDPCVYHPFPPLPLPSLCTYALLSYVWMSSVVCVSSVFLFCFFLCSDIGHNSAGLDSFNVLNWLTSKAKIFKLTGEFPNSNCRTLSTLSGCFNWIITYLHYFPQYRDEVKSHLTTYLARSNNYNKYSSPQKIFLWLHTTAKHYNL